MQKILHSFGVLVREALLVLKSTHKSKSSNEEKNTIRLLGIVDGAHFVR